MHPQPCSCPDLKPPRFQRKWILRRCSSSPTSCPSCSITGAVPPRAQPQRRRQQSTRKQPAPEGTRAKSPGPAPARYLGIEQKQTVRVDMGRSGQGRESKPTSERGHVREASCGPDHGAVLLYTSSAHRPGVRALETNGDLGPQLASSFPCKLLYLQRNCQQ